MERSTRQQSLQRRQQQQGGAADLIRRYQRQQTVHRGRGRPVGTVEEVHVQDLPQSGLAGALRRLRREQHHQGYGCKLAPRSLDVEVHDRQASSFEGMLFLATEERRRHGDEANGGEQRDAIGTVRLVLPRSESAFDWFSRAADRRAARQLYANSGCQGRRAATKIGVVESLYVRADSRRREAPESNTASFDLAQAALNRARSLRLDVLLFEPDDEGLRQRYQSFCGGAMRKVDGAVRLFYIDVAALSAYLATV